jgi:prevent-host-death family protein
MRLAAGQFKATCLKVMDRVRRTREPVVITKRGKPMARLVPFAEDMPVPLFGYLAGTVTILGDVVEPSVEPWDADK